MKAKFTLLLITLFSYYNAIGNNTIPGDTIAKNIIVSGEYHPQKDGVDKIYYIQSLDSSAVKKIQMQIYNRWGEKVCEITNLQQGWDGIYNGSPLSAGVYVYIINGELYDITNDKQIIEFNHTGTLYLIR